MRLFRRHRRAGGSGSLYWPDEVPSAPVAEPVLGAPTGQPEPASVRPGMRRQDRHAAATSGPEPAGRRPALRAAALGCGVLLLMALEFGWLVGVLRSPRPSALAPSGWSLPALSAPAMAIGGARPGSAAQAPVRPAAGPAALAGWAAALAPRVGIPAVALADYGSAELELARERPGCHLSWAVLAGIGSVESDHGRAGGSVLLPDGHSRPPIVGVPLNGRGVALLPDTDRGVLDGDSVYDRAVGPMQFLPSTWRRWAADGDGDGRADPFDLADAALAAGRYLCAAGGGNLRRAGPWTAAVLAYNASAAYLAEVTKRADGYAAASLAR